MYEKYKGKKVASMLCKNAEVVEEDGDKVLTDSMKKYAEDNYLKLTKAEVTKNADIKASFDKLITKLSIENGYLTIEQFKTYVDTLTAPTLAKDKKDAILAEVVKVKKAIAKMLYQYNTISMKGDDTVLTG